MCIQIGAASYSIGTACVGAGIGAGIGIGIGLPQYNRVARSRVVWSRAKESNQYVDYVCAALMVLP